MAIMKYQGPDDEMLIPVERLANELFGHGWGHMLTKGDAVPRVNIVERKADYQLEMQVPGFNKKDLTVQMHGDTLTVRGEHATDARKEEGRYTRREFHHASFERSFVLPNSADQGKVVADYANGVLTLTIPKHGESKPKARQISIK